MKAAVVRRLVALSMLVATSITAVGGLATSTAASAASHGTINVGYICSCSGAQASSFQYAASGAQAWVAATNAKGGLNGYHINLISKDDAGNPVQALQDAQTLVQQNHIIALVDGSTVDTSFASYLQKAGVPALGSTNAPYTTNPDFFNDASGLYVVTYGLVQQLKKAGVSKVGELYCAEAPVCGQYSTVSNVAATQLGMGYTGLKTSSALPNYTAQCLTMKNGGVNGFDAAMAVTQAVSIVDQCEQLGFKPKLFAAGGSVEAALIADPHFENMISDEGVAAYNDTALPATNQFNAALAKYEPAAVSQASEAAGSWLGASLLGAASTSAGGFTSKSTAADVKKGLYGLKNETLGGWAPELNFKPGKVPTQPLCYFVQTIKNKQLTPVGTKPVCISKAAFNKFSAQVTKELPSGG